MSDLTVTSNNMIAMTSHENYITRSEVKEFLGIVDDRTLRRYMKELGLPHYRIGRRLRFRRCEVEEFFRRKFSSSGIVK